MEKNKKDPFFLPLVAILIFAAFYLIWQLVGIRYANHDDIYFNLNTNTFFETPFLLAKYLAFHQARFQAFINVPIVLLVHQIYTSPWFDVLNIGTFGLAYAAMIWVLAKMGSKGNAFAIAAMTLIFYPLHYYYMFPHGFPVMFSWGFAFAFSSAALLASHLKSPKRWKLSLSVFLFTSSLIGEEYNFILHPAFLVVVFWSQADQKWKEKLNEVVWPYLGGGTVIAAIYILFMTIAHNYVVKGYRPVSLEGFSFLKWLQTFYMLTQQSFLPLGLFHGIQLQTAAEQGSPEVPDLITYSTLWGSIQNDFSAYIIFLFMFFLCLGVLLLQKFSAKVIRDYSVFFLCIGIIPCLLVAVSPFYQMMVLGKRVSGHLISFYVQLGFSGVVFLFFVSLCNRASGRFRATVVLFSALVLSVLAMTNLIYNNLTRQAMMANKQKWDAMRELVTFVKSDRPDLAGKKFYAPTFWAISGVSYMPRLQGSSYWREYSENILKFAINIHWQNENFLINSVQADYFSNPAGVPVVIVSERISENNHWGIMTYYWRMTLIASKPVAGTLIYQSNRKIAKHLSSDQWACAASCTNIQNIPDSYLPENFRFRPDDRGPHNLLAQLFLPRAKPYAHPLENSRVHLMGNQSS